MTDKIVVLTTCDSEKQAVDLARSLVEQRVAACVNILPGARSIYRWNDKAGKENAGKNDEGNENSGKDEIEDSAEWMLVIKSRRDLFPALRAAVEKLHTYEVPELIALPIVEGSEPYLAWLDRELASSK